MTVISKTQLNSGKYVRALDLSPSQRISVRMGLQGKARRKFTGMTPEQRELSDKYNEGLVQTRNAIKSTKWEKRGKNVYTAQGDFTDGDVKDWQSLGALPKKAKRPMYYGVMPGIKSGATFPTGSKKHPVVVGVESEGNSFTRLSHILAHETAHAHRASAGRSMRRNADPVLRMREEARADSLAHVNGGNVRFSGYDSAARGDNKGIVAPPIEGAESGLNRDGITAYRNMRAHLYPPVEGRIPVESQRRKRFPRLRALGQEYKRAYLAERERLLAAREPVQKSAFGVVHLKSF